jgi:hypothetical protein
MNIIHMATSKMEDGSTGEFSMIEINRISEYSIFGNTDDSDVMKEMFRRNFIDHMIRICH